MNHFPEIKDLDPLIFCSCIGPAYDEPFCYCEMVRQGLPFNEDARKESEARMTKTLGEIFGWT